ncbi:MAG: hypothetical protein L0Y44_02075 [Phycisphaerales bacterium]|nr:hypothetical protein [Phycisphaerales bacterium]
MHHLITPVAVMLLLSLTPGNEIHGQCGSSWTAGPAPAVNGVNGPIYASLSWDHDSVPTTPNWLVVGGSFSVAGATQANNIAAWDGATWHKFGLGTSGAVRALEIYNGQLAVGGDFILANNVAVNRIALWNGSTFQALGSGMTGYDVPSVRALLAHAGNLYAGGLFLNAGGADAWNIARWNGSSWSAMGEGLNGMVEDLVIVDGGLTLVAGGWFDASPDDPVANRVGKWVGEPYNTWLPYWIDSEFPNYEGPGGFIHSRVNAFFFDGLTNELFAGGLWYRNGSLQHIAVKPLAMGWHDEGPLEGEVFAVTRYDNEIIAGDQIRNGNQPWPLLGGGINGTVYSLAVHGFFLYACGNLSGAGVPNGIAASNIAKWDTSAWSQVVPDIAVRAMTYFAGGAGSLLAGGNFIWPDPGDPGDTIDYVAISVGQQVFNTGNGLNGPVNAALNVGSAPFAQLYVGGEFTIAGGLLVNRIAQLSIFDEWMPMGAGFNNAVHALAAHDGSVYAGGAFTASGATAINHVARWDGTNWQPVGAGLDDTVHVLLSFDGLLYAGGTFTTSGGFSRHYLAQWNGSVWQKVGLPMQGDQLQNNGPGSGVFALTLHNDTLRIGGRFTYSNGIQSAANLIGWNGTAWTGFVIADNTVRALTTHNADLYAGGDFATIAGMPASRIAKLDTNNGWQSLGTGVNGTVRAMQSYSGRLHVGGSFTSAGGLNSPYWAVWEDNIAPAIAQQPQDLTIACGGTAVFTVVPASGSDPPTYQWRLNSASLNDGPQPNGSTISGATSAVLTINNAGGANAGSYDVVLSNTCGSTTSAVATLDVIGCETCPADVAPQPAGDGLVNVNDLLAVIAAWGACAGCQADLNADGVVNVDDLLAVITAWGPCP